jgi:pimeloyl-ACP methyl ester carboxylesterase
MAQDDRRQRAPKAWRRLGLRYDPHLGDPLKTDELPDVVLWLVWSAIDCPTLILRGANSNVLARDVAEKMTRTGPKAKLVEFGGVGHAPALLHDDQLETVREFLAG